MKTTDHHLIKMIFEAIVLLLLTFSTFSNGLECDKKYLNISLQHTMCQNPNPYCKIIEKELTNEEKDLIVKVHNELRNKIATGKERNYGSMPPAADMLQMEWDDELATIAQKHGELCSFTHDCEECRSVERFPVGQNIDMTFTRNATKKDLTESILAFYEEVRNFNKSLIPAYNFSFNDTTEYGHFTQVIWSQSWKIGCGYVQFQEEDDQLQWITSQLICNYGPAGNIYGTRVYKEGDPCSSCPQNTCCNDKCASFNKTVDYPGLCKTII